MKKWLFLFLGIVGIVLFNLQVFVFESPDGFIGYLVCLFSVLLTIISFIKLECQVSNKFREVLKNLLEIFS